MRGDTHNRKRFLVWVAVLAIMIGSGALLLTIGRPPSSAPSASTPTSTVRPVVPPGATGPVADHAGLPVGFAHEEGGATAAAVAYATAPQRWLYFTDAQITAAVVEIATPAAAPRLTEEVVSDVSSARDQLGKSPGRVWWLVRPLAWRVDSYDPDEATVSVWTVTVLSAEEVAAPQCEWVTVTLELAWVDGDWRVDGVRDTPGPTPLTSPGDQPWDAGPFDQALTGFSRMDGEAVS